ncbi:hypothetical protein FQR65_LT05885 [Abscondita terminalis]|nr:hypothetical protein FQR65_LT05885 [Abscondita terminalis]
MLKYKLIAAASQNRGIGKNNDLPWRIRKDMDYFTKMTTSTTSSKKNVVIMGRKTWDSIPTKFKPLSNRINFILSRSDINVGMYKNVFLFKSWDDINKKLQNEEFQKLYEDIWIIGGSHIYKAAIESKHFYRLYMTEIKKEYDCDTFFPSYNNVKPVSDPLVPEGVQEEKGIKFEFKVYENELYEE